MIQSAIEEN